MAILKLPDQLRETISTFDANIDARVDQLRGNPTADRLFYGLSEVGDFSLIWHVIGWSRVAHDRSHLRSAVELSVALGIESALVNGLIKSLFRRERPEWDQDRPRHLRKPRSSSFPSGHASSAFMAARILGRLTGHPVPLHVLAAMVAYSRAHVRIHHASDVAGGVVTGAVLGEIAVSVLDQIDR